LCDSKRKLASLFQQNRTVSVRNGGRIELVAAGLANNGPQLSIGRDAASAGALSIAGSGSVVSLSAASVLAGGGPGEAFNPLMRVGRDGSGTLNITAGGKLLIDGQAVSTVADSRGTSLYVGGSGDTSVGGKGIALVSGTGSAIQMTGTDTFLAVGIGPQSFGQLTVADGGTVSAMIMNVGRSGGVGVLSMDNASLSLAGQQTGSSVSGAALSIGRSGGTGIANIGNGSRVTVTNLGSSGASVNLGGTGPGPTGDGTLTLSGGSSIQVVVAPGLASLVVGRDGTGLMRVKGASTVDVGDGAVFVGRLKGSDGTLLVSEGSTVSAARVYVVGPAKSICTQRQQP
jgi:T5SS/PEP-CTERM-associated repeat protein